MGAVDVVSAWFDAHRRGDLERARGLLAPDARVLVPGDALTGFDALMTWYDGRRALEGSAFGYQVDDLLGGADHAAAVITLRNAERSWRQVAVYRVEAGRITGMWLSETTQPF